MFKLALMLLGLVVLLYFGASFYAGWRVRGALLETGMSERVASCMARRMVRRLSFVQLMKLQALEGDKPTPRAWIRAVQQVDDSKVILVTTSSAALCRVGIAR
jgi:hypothetical protein